MELPKSGVESIKQDFYATIYITGLESILTEKAEEELSKRITKHEYHVNKMVSFNVIKNQVIDLLYYSAPIQVVEFLNIIPNY